MRKAIANALSRTLSGLAMKPTTGIQLNRPQPNRRLDPRGDRDSGNAAAVSPPGLAACDHPSPLAR